MQILQKPTAYSFAGNILDIVVSSEADFTFKLSLNGVEQLSERYSPDSTGRVAIKLRHFVERFTPVALIEAGEIYIPAYTYVVGTLPVETFRCVCGGHGSGTDAATFMRSNWLSWQPQSRTTTYHTPQRLCYAALVDCVVKVKAYFADKTSLQLNYKALQANKLYTIDTTFGSICGFFDAQPTSFDIWVEGNGLQSYTQRYYLARQEVNADTFMWYGSLGGIETAIFTGERVEKSDIESMYAILADNSNEQEYDITSKKSFTKYTGYIDNDNARLWVLDFFNSINRYHLDQGALRRIVVSKPKIEHTRGELAGYEFVFSYNKQSRYINLPRLTTPAELTIVAPDGELFFLAPRLNQFARAEFAAGDILIPVQYAGDDRWVSLALADILANAGGGGSGGIKSISGAAPIKVIVNGNSYTITHLPPEREEDATDFNRYGNIDETGHVISDYHPHGGRADVDFAAKAVRADYVGSVDMVPAMVGCGNAMMIDPDTGQAHIWTDHIHTRQSFETLEMRYRKMIVSGEELVVNNGGVVASVMAVGETILTTAGGKQGGDIQGGKQGRKQGGKQGGAAAALQDIEPIVTQDGDYIIWPLAAGEQRLTFAIKGEAGIDYQQFVAGDILRYTWRDAATGAKGASGYLTVYAVVNEFTYIADVIEGSPEWLQVGMTLALWGNLYDPSRQGFIVLSAREKTVAIYDGVNSTAITPANLKVLLGNLSGIVDPAFGSRPLSGYGLYSQHCYLRGKFVLRSTGRSVEDELGAVRSEFNTSFEVANGKIESKVSNDVYESYVKQTAEKFEVKADKIELNGLVKADDIMVSGKLKAELIDTDKLTARSIDTRDVGNVNPHARGGVLMSYNREAPDELIEFFGGDGERTGYIGASSGLRYDDIGRAVSYSRSGLVTSQSHPLSRRTEFNETGFCKNDTSINPVKAVLAFQENRVVVPPDATIDMPGVLCVGRVNGTLCSVSSQMGIMEVSVERVPGQTKGVYRLIYNRLAAGAKHFTVPTIYGKTYASLTIRVEDETANYTDIRVHDNTNLNATVNSDFNFIIYGENKW